MILRLVAVGLVSILGQVVLLRELSVAFYGVELIYILALAFWLLWTAAGALSGRRSKLPPSSGVPALLVAAALALPLSVALVRASRLLLGGVPGAYLPFTLQVAGLAASLLPFCFLMGLLFQWAAKAYVEDGRTLARAYAIESAGAVAGGLLATLLLMLGVQNFQAALLCGFAAAGAVLPPAGGRRSRGIGIAAGGTCLLLAVALAFSGSIDRRLTRLNHPALAATRDTPYGRVTLARTGEQVTVFINDALAWESQGTAAEEFVHMAALQHPAPERVLLLGGGVEGLPAEIGKHGPRRIDHVELNRPLLELALPLLPAEHVHALDDPALKTVFADPRAFLRSGREGEPAWDLVLVAMPEPASGQDARFYTREFFHDCRQNLAPDGVLAFRLPAAENLWSPHLVARNASIHRALREAFPDVLVLPGPVNIFLASGEPLERNPAVLASRLESRGIETRLVSPAWIAYVLTNDRRAEVERLMRGARVPANSDTRPVCYQYTLVQWLSRFFPALAMRAFDPASLRGSMLPAAVISFFVLSLALGFLRGWIAFRRVALAALAGFLGMVLESCAILGYQIRSGVLYQDLGLLLTLFMAGLAAGAWVVERTTRRGEGVRPEPRAMGFVGAFALALLCLAAAARPGPGLVVAAALLLGAGLLTSALFAWASLLDWPGQRGVVSPLYGADLLGGCAGSLAATLFLVPVAGLALTPMLLFLLALLALLLV